MVVLREGSIFINISLSNNTKNSKSVNNYNKRNINTKGAWKKR